MDPSNEEIAREYWDQVMNWNSKVKWLHAHGMKSDLFKRDYADLPYMTQRALITACSSGGNPS